MGAPLQPVPSVVAVTLEGFVDTSAADTLWVNRLHFQYTGSPPSNTTCASIANGISTTWAGSIASLCPSPTTLQAVTVTDLSSPSGGFGEALVLHPGTRGDDSIPANAAVLISYPVQTRYKGGHPRQYLYVLGNADLLGATNWSTLATGEVQDKWRQFLGNCLTISVSGTTLSQFVGVSYRSKFAPNSGPPHFYRTTPLVLPINAQNAAARQQIASQRGRIGRRKA